MAGFVDVLLRGLALCGQAVAVGGVLFAVLLLRPEVAARPTLAPRLTRSLALTAIGAAVAAAAQVLALVVQLGVLADATASWPLGELIHTSYFRAGLMRIAACLGLIAGCTTLSNRGGAGRWWWIALLGLTAVLGVGSAWTSHAAGRLGPRGLLLTLDALHQLAAGVWIGGLFHLVVVALSRVEDAPQIGRAHV